jgi:hypothetical protein
VNGGRIHAMALRAPWYTGVRGDFDRFDKRAAAPVIQKFDTPEFVRQVLADPSASLEFTARDKWTFPVPRRAADPVGSFRERLSPFRLAQSSLLKLYQPSHQRFYTVAAELFCDVPGLPRPGRDDDVTVRFVVRRLHTAITDSDAARKAVRDLARAAAKELYGTEYPNQGGQVGAPKGPFDPTGEQAEDVVGVFAVDAETDEERQKREQFELDHAGLIVTAGLAREVQGWYLDQAGTGGWVKVPGPDDPPVHGTELELPMFKVPAVACAGSTPPVVPQRSLWFGAIPTYSGDLDVTGRPRLDDRSTYVIQCVARRDRPGCPPLESRSEYTRPYRLAAFFDPAGNANRRIHVRMPDFAAVAAQAAQAGPAGGVVFERPPGSQLPPLGLGVIPTSHVGAPGGDTSENCSFSIELITIVATFVLGIFLPVVVFAFQLWWLLLLKFCWPRDADTEAVLSALDSAPITGLGGLSDDFARMIGVDDAAVVTQLFEPDADLQVKNDKANSLAFAQAAVQAADPAPPAHDPSEEPVTDPLCPAPTVRLR